MTPRIWQWPAADVFLSRRKLLLRLSIASVAAGVSRTVVAEPAAAQVNWRPGTADVRIANRELLANGAVKEDLEIAYRLVISAQSAVSNRISLVPLEPVRVAGIDIAAYDVRAQPRVYRESIYRLYQTMLVDRDTISGNVRTSWPDDEIEQVIASARRHRFNNMGVDALRSFLVDQEQASLMPERTMDWLLYVRHFERVASLKTKRVVASVEPGLGAVRVAEYPPSREAEALKLQIGILSQEQSADAKPRIHITALFDPANLRVKSVVGIEDGRPQGTLRNLRFDFTWY